MAEAVLAESEPRHVADRELLGAFRRAPYATWTLASSLVVVFVLAWVRYGSVDLTDPDGYTAMLLAGARVGPLIRDGELWRLVTSLWLHASVLHLLFNVATLVLLGSIVERLYGWRPMLAVYLAAGLGANVALLGSDAPSVGASACVAGLLGMLLGFSARWGRQLPRPLLRLAMGNALLAVAACWVLSRESEAVDHAAHAVGALVGFLAALVTSPSMAGAWAGRSARFGVAVGVRGQGGTSPARQQGSGE